MQTQHYRVEDDAWLNDMHSVVTEHAIACEDIPTIPLYQARAKATRPAPVPQASDMPRAEEPTRSDAVTEGIGVGHRLWPILYAISSRLWLEIHRAHAHPVGSEALHLPSASLLRERVLQQLPVGLSVTDAEREVVVQGVIDEVIGAGPLAALLLDESVSALTVYAPHEIVVERNQHTQSAPCLFVDERHLLHILENLLCQAGQRLRPHWPLAEVQLPDGTLLSITMPPTSPRGPTFTLRKCKQTKRTLADLVDEDLLDQTMADFLYTCMLDQRNILLCGDTESGKTLLLNALCACIPERERIVVIEDAMVELVLTQRQVVTLLAHPANATSSAQITLDNLVQHALRMRPERLILAATNGDEWVSLLQAMYAGQRGVCAFMYAQSARDVLQRLETLYHACRYETNPALIRAQIMRSLDVIVHVKKMQDESVRIVNIVEVVSATRNGLKIQSLFHYREVCTEQITASHVEGFRPRFLP